MEKLFEELLNPFKKIKFSEPDIKETTIFDVAGFPHYENVASNVLQFFINTNNSDKYHGFGNLWLNAIINAYNQKSDIKIPEGSYFTNDVKREYSNGSDKRIDLLIDCESMIIVIENKIYADIYNDLKLYTVMAKNYKNPSGGIKGIVLSLFPVKDKDNSLEKANYINILYEDIFEYVENNFEFDDSNKWQLLAKDFMSNIRQLKGIIKMKFDQEWFNFVNNNGNSLNELFKLYRNDQEMRLNLLRELDKALDEVGGIIRHGVYNSSSERYVSEYIDVVRDGNNTICIETYLMKEYSKEDWERFNTVYVCVWARKNKNYDFTNVLNKLKLANPKIEVTPGWGKHYVLKEMELNDDFDMQELKDSVVSFVKTLLK